MVQHYLFRCSSCEKDYGITVKQAGMTGICPFCEKSNSFPGMREIRQLPADEAATTDSDSFKSETKSWLFSGGLLVGVVFGLLGLALLGYANSITKDSKVQQIIDQGQAQINSVQSGMLWEYWDSMTQEGLPDWKETPAIRSNKQAGYLSLIAYGLFGASALGLIAMVVSLLTGKRS